MRSYNNIKKKQILNLMISKGLCHPNSEIYIHNQSGRNTLYTIGNDEISQLFVKQGPPSRGISKECLFYENVEDHELLIKPILNIPEINLCVFRYINSLETYESISVFDYEQAVSDILSISIKSLNFLKMQPFEHIGEQQIPFTLNRKDERFLFDVSMGFVDLIRFAEKYNLIERSDFDHKINLCFSHGDIKLDNMARINGVPILFDFENCCMAPYGFDAAGYVSSMCMATIRAAAASPDGKLVSFRNAIAAGQKTFEALNEYRCKGVRTKVDEELFSKMIARQLLYRAGSEAMHKNSVSDLDFVAIEVAKSILDRGIIGMTENAGNN